MSEIRDQVHLVGEVAPQCPRSRGRHQELEERFATVCRVGGEEVWLAEPNDVVAHLLAMK